MTRLSSSAREALYDAEAAKAKALGRGDLPLCVHCDLPIDGRHQRWQEAHDPHRPRFLGGRVVGIAHVGCNQRHNNIHDTPLYAKVKRQRQRYIGARRPRQIMPGSREHWAKRQMDGTVVPRRPRAEPAGGRP